MIFFVFSAASPFDKSDAPLLIELHGRLPFIPIHFVVTRTDELRVDPDSPLTEENLDPQRRDRFLRTVVERVNTLLSPQVYTTHSFSLIDNRAQFRVEQLKALLLSRCSSSNPQAHVSMHINKLHFYRSSSKSLRIFFSAILVRKLDGLTRIVEAAKRNIERYQQLVQISNSNLTKTWMEHSASINAAATNALETVRALDALPQEYTGFRSVVAKRTDLSNDLGRSARYHAGSVGSALKAKINGMLQEHLYELQKQIASVPLPELSAEVYGSIKAPSVPTPSLDELQSPSSLNHSGGELREAEAEALREAAALMRRALTVLHEQVSQRAPLCSAPECIQAAIESLKTDLNQFFQNVELYRSGVFSHATKESIATLGIGAELDALETEFTEADREEFTLSASSDLFPGAQALVDSATTRATQLSRRALELVEESRSVRVERPEDNLVALREIVGSERETLGEQLRAGLQNEIDRLYSGISITLANLIVQAKTRCDSDLKLLKRARITRYSIAFVVTGVIFACASFVYHHFGQPAPTTFIGEALLHLGTGALLEIVVLGVLKIRENVPKLLSHTREKVQVKLQSDIKQALDAQVNGLALNCLNEQVLGANVAKIYEQALDLSSAAWRARAKETLDSIRNFLVKYADLRSTYADIVEQVRQDALQYFVDPSKNLSVLNAVAGRIKAKAIEPSFELLEATREELLTIKTDVEAISFD